MSIVDNAEKIVSFLKEEGYVLQSTSPDRRTALLNKQMHPGKVFQVRLQIKGNILTSKLIFGLYAGIWINSTVNFKILRRSLGSAV